MAFTVGEMAAQLHNRRTPLVFVDTCVILDVLRSPMLKLGHGTGVLEVTTLLELSNKTPPVIILATCDTVVSEFHKNISGATCQLSDWIDSIERGRARIVSTISELSGSTPSHRQSEASLRLEEELGELAFRFLSGCSVVEAEDAHAGGALRRIKGNLPPASRGKNEAKDCEIFEVFLDLCRQSRDQGYSGKAVFVSSNTSDFGKPGDGALDSDLHPLDACHRTNLAWTLSELNCE